MRLIHFMGSTQLSLSKMVVSFLIVIVLAACGTNTTTTSSPTKSHPKAQSQAKATGASSFSLAPSTADLSTDAGSLRVQSRGGFQCPANPTLVRNQLVLASSRTTYSQDEIAQIHAYANSNFSAEKLPPTLRLVLGGSMDSIPETGESGPLVCGATLSLTNTGSTPIQVPNVGVQLEAPPQQNSYQYHLIDACSILPPRQGGCFVPSGGGASCSIYSAPIQLGLGEKGTLYSVAPTGYGNNCGTLTIAPASPVELHLTFSLAANSGKSLIYSVVPVLTVDTGQGKQALPLPQFITALAFASANQFSCYTLQGTNFVPLKPPSFPQNWCI